MYYCALDVGNVLAHVDFQVFVQALSKQLNLPVEEAEYFMNRTHSLHDMGLTKMFDELHDHFKIRSPFIIKDLLNIWNKVITPNYEMIDKMLEMMDKGTKIALLSNVGLEHAELMSKILNHDYFFTRCIKHLSCQVGARKPTKLYYQSFLSQHPEFQGCAYLDDMRENLDMGEQFGFRTYYFSLDEMEGKVSLAKRDEIESFIVGASQF